MTSRTALALASLCLAGCGLHPLYGSGDASASGAANADVAVELASVQVDTIADRQGQELRNVLIDTLQGDGVPPPAKYELNVTYNEAQEDLGINNNATSTRGQLTFSATFTLTNKVTGLKETSGSLQNITGYNIQYSEFSTIVSRDDAELRALRGAAQNIVARLSFYFENKLHDPDRLKNKPAQASPPKMPQPMELPNPLNSAQPFAGQTPITQGPE